MRRLEVVNERSSMLKVQSWASHGGLDSTSAQKQRVHLHFDPHLHMSEIVQVVHMVTWAFSPSSKLPRGVSSGTMLSIL